MFRESRFLRGNTNKQTNNQANKFSKRHKGFPKEKVGGFVLSFYDCIQRLKEN